MEVVVVMDTRREESTSLIDQIIFARLNKIQLTYDCALALLNLPIITPCLKSNCYNIEIE